MSNKPHIINLQFKFLATHFRLGCQNCCQNDIRKLVWDAGCSWLLWKGYLNSSLLPLLPELTRITLMGLVLSPMVPGTRGGGVGEGVRDSDSGGRGGDGTAGDGGEKER